MSDQLLESLSAKLAKYPRSQAYLDDLKAVLPQFIPAHLDDAVKAKVEVAIKRAYRDSGAYDAQSDALKVINEIETSHLLGMNEVVVPVLVQEYATLFKLLEAIEKGLATLKPFPQAKALCEAMLKPFNRSGLGDHLRYDLGVLQSQYGVAVDLAGAMGEFKRLRSHA